MKFSSSALTSWNDQNFLQKAPPIKKIALLGKKEWDAEIQFTSVSLSVENPQLTFTMPCFARHGRWGNMVFQYIFMRILEWNNNGKIELYKNAYVSPRLSLYKDMMDIAPVQTKSNCVLLDSYHIFFGALSYIPAFFWRAMYISKVRLQQCFILKNVCEAVNNPLSVEGGTCIEVEGLFIVNPRLYKKHKEFILSKLLKPATGFECIIDNCMEQFGQNKTVIGIHIRRGDFVLNPLEGSFVLPIPVKYILSWLAANISYIENPAIFVCSDDKNVYKEIEKAGFEVFTTARLFAEGAEPFNYEQLEWEILRRCDILLNSNSTFSFSAAMLSNTIPVCYQFSVKEKKFIPFDPWMSEPLQFYTSAPYLWSYLYTRFTLVANMVSKKSALRRLGKDINRWLFWKSTKVTRLYYLYGLSSTFFFKIFNFFEFFQLSAKHKSCLDYDETFKLKI